MEEKMNFEKMESPNKIIEAVTEFLKRA